MRDDRRRGGWFTTLLALIALVVVGFLCGALAGFLWEEPGLVVAYLSGETEAVEWSDPAPVAAEPPRLQPEGEMATAPPPTRAAPEPAPEPEPAQVARSEPASEPPPPPAAKPAPAPAAKRADPAPAAEPSARFAVQVGAFGESDAAEQLAEHLRARGYTTYVRASTESGESRWRVRVGPVAARAQAEDLAAKLQKGEKLPTWVLDEGES